MKRLFFLLLALLPSCAYLPRFTSTPVKSISAGPDPAKELVVLLPGRWSLVTEFENEGFFKIAREHWPEAQLIAPDLHLGYYKSQTMPQRLHEDVIAPALESGVEKITIVGISMGGLGALIYDLGYPGNIDEIILLSPFLGEESVIQEIIAAGGLKNWEPGIIEEKDFSSKLWNALRKEYSKAGRQPSIHLASGTEDRLIESNRLFAKEFLTAGNQTWQPGGHDWPTWRKLFAEVIRE